MLHALAARITLHMRKKSRGAAAVRSVIRRPRGNSWTACWRSTGRSRHLGLEFRINGSI